MRSTATLGIVGMGHVGTMTAEAFQRTSEIVTYDISTDSSYPRASFARCDFIIVCVNTPSMHDGSVDLTQVEEAFTKLPPGIPVVLRSTVPPGTTDELAKRHDRHVVFWPEYIGEKRFVQSTWSSLAAEAPFQLFGARTSHATTSWLDRVAETFGPLVRIQLMTPSEAELVKYMENSWLAVKVTFVNEFRRLAEGLGLEWHRVREGWLLDPRINRDHSDAFASDPGYGGKCLPKDVSGILNAAAVSGVDLPLIRAVESINAATRRGVRES